MSLVLATTQAAVYSQAMALEQLSENTWDFSPGPFDVHAHPRVFDTLNEDDFPTINAGTEGKAGLRVYTEAALRSGITGMAAMPNESVRLYDEDSPGKTKELPYPIADYSRVLAMQAAIAERAVIPTAVYMGIDPRTAFWDEAKTRLRTQRLSTEFEKVSDECLGLKVYLAETTGGNNISLEHAAEVTALWYQYNPEKPVIFHVEDKDVARLFDKIRRVEASTGSEERRPIGHLIPMRIAHVTSRQELQAVMDAKRSGVNVSCEATPHHLFLDESALEEIGGYGCMKPGLKSTGDVAFLWDNMDAIDMFASDCAPHRISDKEKDSPAFGVTNHTIMLPLLLGAVQEGRLSMEDIYQKFCVAPRQHLNLPLDDGSLTRVSTAPETASLTAADHDAKAEYGQNPFARLGERFHLLGKVILARAGVSGFVADFSGTDMRSSYCHQIRPANLRAT